MFKKPVAVSNQSSSGQLLPQAPKVALPTATEDSYKKVVSQEMRQGFQSFSMNTSMNQSHELRSIDSIESIESDEQTIPTLKDRIVSIFHSNDQHLFAELMNNIVDGAEIQWSYDLWESVLEDLLKRDPQLVLQSNKEICSIYIRCIDLETISIDRIKPLIKTAFIASNNRLIEYLLHLIAYKGLLCFYRETQEPIFASNPVDTLNNIIWMHGHKNQVVSDKLLSDAMKNIVTLVIESKEKMVQYKSDIESLSRMLSEDYQFFTRLRNRECLKILLESTVNLFEKDSDGITFFDRVFIEPEIDLKLKCLILNSITSDKSNQLKNIGSFFCSQEYWEKLFKMFQHPSIVKNFFKRESNENCLRDDFRAVALIHFIRQYYLVILLSKIDDKSKVDIISNSLEALKKEHPYPSPTELDCPVHFIESLVEGINSIESIEKSEGVADAFCVLVSLLFQSPLLQHLFRLGKYYPVLADYGLNIFKKNSLGDQSIFEYIFSSSKKYMELKLIILSQKILSSEDLKTVNQLMLTKDYWEEVDEVLNHSTYQKFFRDAQKNKLPREQKDELPIFWVRIRLYKILLQSGLPNEVKIKLMSTQIPSLLNISSAAISKQITLSSLSFQDIADVIGMYIEVVLRSEYIEPNSVESKQLFMLCIQLLIYNNKEIQGSPFLQLSAIRGYIDLALFKLFDKSKSEINKRMIDFLFIRGVSDLTGELLDRYCLLTFPEKSFTHINHVFSTQNKLLPENCVQSIVKFCAKNQLSESCVSVLKYQSSHEKILDWLVQSITYFSDSEAHRERIINCFFHVMARISVGKQKDAYQFLYDQRENFDRLMRYCSENNADFKMHNQKLIEQFLSYAELPTTKEEGMKFETVMDYFRAFDYIFSSEIFKHLCSLGCSLEIVKGELTKLLSEIPPFNKELVYFCVRNAILYNRLDVIQHMIHLNLVQSPFNDIDFDWDVLFCAKSELILQYQSEFDFAWEVSVQQKGEDFVKHAVHALNNRLLGNAYQCEETFLFLENIVKICSNKTVELVIKQLMPTVCGIASKMHHFVSIRMMHSLCYLFKKINIDDFFANLLIISHMRGMQNLIQPLCEFDSYASIAKKIRGKPFFKDVINYPDNFKILINLYMEQVFLNDVDKDRMSLSTFVNFFEYIASEYIASKKLCLTVADSLFYSKFITNAFKQLSKRVEIDLDSLSQGEELNSVEFDLLKVEFDALVQIEDYFIKVLSSTLEQGGPIDSDDIDSDDVASFHESCWIQMLEQSLLFGRKEFTIQLLRLYKEFNLERIVTQCLLSFKPTLSRKDSLEKCMLSVFANSLSRESESQKKLSMIKHSMKQKTVQASGTGEFTQRTDWNSMVKQISTINNSIDQEVNWIQELIQGRDISPILTVLRELVTKRVMQTILTTGIVNSAGHKATNALANSFFGQLLLHADYQEIQKFLKTQLEMNRSYLENNPNANPIYVNQMNRELNETISELILHHDFKCLFFIIKVLPQNFHLQLYGISGEKFLIFLSEIDKSSVLRSFQKAILVSMLQKFFESRPSHLL